MSDIIVIEKKGKKLNCQRCGHLWIYTGNNKFICSCPHCKTTITIKKKTLLHVENEVGASNQHAMRKDHYGVRVLS